MEEYLSRFMLISKNLAFEVLVCLEVNTNYIYRFEHHRFNHNTTCTKCSMLNVVLASYTRVFLNGM
jgi:hypothetical protein